MLAPEAQGDILVVAKEHPELDEGKGADPGYGEQAHPLDADRDTQPETSHSQPEPPDGLECLGRTKLMLIREA